ncbi:hypothetical protein Tco_0592614 [Tanacetum coccineum]
MARCSKKHRGGALPAREAGGWWVTIVDVEILAGEIGVAPEGCFINRVSNDCTVFSAIRVALLTQSVKKTPELDATDWKSRAKSDPNHLIGECSKSPNNNDQRAFIGGAWSNNGEDEVGKTKDETCLVAQAPDEICLGVNLEPDEWIKDSGCSKHMTEANRSAPQLPSPQPKRKRKRKKRHVNKLYDESCSHNYGVKVR